MIRNIVRVLYIHKDEVLLVRQKTSRGILV